MMECISSGFLDDSGDPQDLLFPQYLLSPQGSPFSSRNSYTINISQMSPESSQIPPESSKMSLESSQIHSKPSKISK